MHRRARQSHIGGIIMACFKLTQDDAAWAQFGEAQIYIGDVWDEARSTSMGVGYARWEQGEANAWTVSYDEVLIVVSGTITVQFGQESVTAGPGELIWLEKGTSVVYRGDTAAVVVYVTYPVWGATEESKAASDVLRPVGAPAEASAR
jgi:ethanolamine utilization protein EutQ (cupin superfamily)